MVVAWLLGLGMVLLLGISTLFAAIPVLFVAGIVIAVAVGRGIEHGRTFLAAALLAYVTGVLLPRIVIVSGRAIASLFPSAPTPHCSRRAPTDEGLLVPIAVVSSVIGFWAGYERVLPWLGFDAFAPSGR